MKSRRYLRKNTNTVNNDNNSTPTFMPLPDSQLPDNLIGKKLSNNGASGSSGMKNTDLTELPLMNPSSTKFINLENTDFVEKISMAVPFSLSE